MELTAHPSLCRYVNNVVLILFMLVRLGRKEFMIIKNLFSNQILMLLIHSSNYSVIMTIYSINSRQNAKKALDFKKRFMW